MFWKLISSGVIIGGISAMIIPFYWGIFDYDAAYKADQLLKKGNLTREQREEVMYRANAHRANVWFEGTWVIMGGILTAMGFILGKDKS